MFADVLAPQYPVAVYEYAHLLTRSWPESGIEFADYERCARSLELKSLLYRNEEFNYMFMLLDEPNYLIDEPQAGWPSGPAVNSPVGSVQEELKHFESASSNLIKRRALLTCEEKKYILPVLQLPTLLFAMRNRFRIVLSGGEDSDDCVSAYFDTDDIRNYRLGLAPGSGKREVCIRQYAQQRLCYLEVKTCASSGDVTTTERLLRNYKDSILVLTPRDKAFIRSQLQSAPVRLVPQVVVNYGRVTFLAINSVERTTVDFNLVYQKQDDAVNVGGAVVVTTRRLPNHAPATAASWLSLHCAKTCFSKYDMGLWLQGWDIPQNEVGLSSWRIG